jgi:hypothetical protein
MLANLEIFMEILKEVLNKGVAIVSLMPQF